MSFNSPSLLGGNGSGIPSGAASAVGGPSATTDNAIARWDGTAGGLIKNSTVLVSDTGDVSVPVGATAGLQLYNTVDQRTNYERLEFKITANTGIIRMDAAGTGTYRSIQIGVSGLPQFNLRTGGSTSGQLQWVGVTTGLAGDISYNMSGAINTATSGTNIGLSVSKTYNQASGTAANTDLLVNRTETALGSGTQRLISLQVAGTERFGVSNSGAVVLANQTSGPGAGGGTLTNAPSAGNPDFWLPVTINGTAHWIPAWAA